MIGGLLIKTKNADIKTCFFTLKELQARVKIIKSNSYYLSYQMNYFNSHEDLEKWLKE